jgi:beta-glucanase (GH16 family)
MRRIAVVVASLICSLLVISPGVAAKPSRLTLERPVQINQTTVRLTGQAPATARKVVLQRRVDGRWVTVTRLRVAHHQYRTQVRVAAYARHYRTVAAGLRSPVRTVPASQPPPLGSTPDPVPDPGADPLPEPLPVDACGAALLAADGSRRACTFADDFSGTQLDRSKWVPQTDFLTGDASGSYACYRNHPDNIGVDQGALRLTVRMETAPVSCTDGELPPTPYTSGMVSTHHLFSQAYGRFEARIRTEAASRPGLHEAFWLWPDDRQSMPVQWPEAGEIDIAETYSEHPTLAIPFLHYTYDDNGGPVRGLNTAWDCVAQRGAWNTFTLEWAPTRLEIFVNGESCLVNTTGDPAFQWKYIVALTAGLGGGSNALVPGTPIPATMSVDYVHVWE